MVGQNYGYSHGQTTLTHIEDGARGTLTEVNGSQRMNRHARMCTAFGNGGHLSGESNMMC